MKPTKHKNTFFFCATHKPPLFHPPEWMMLIRTGSFNWVNSIDASTLVPKYDLLHCYLKGDVAVLAIRRLLQAEIEAGEANGDTFVCGTSFRKFIATRPIGSPARNFPNHCRILVQGSFDEITLWDDLSGQIILPQFLNYGERLGVTAAYARHHTSFAAYLACTSMLIDEGIFNDQDAIRFLAMHGHFLWGFAGTLKVRHFLTIADYYERAAMSFLKNGLVSKGCWNGDQQTRWMAFFLERMSSFVYLQLLEQDGLLKWNSNGSYTLSAGATQGFNCNINTSSEQPDILQTSA